MRRLSVLPLIGFSVFAAGAVSAQFVDQRYVLTEPERQELTAGRDRLRQAVAGLKEQSQRTRIPSADQLPDVEIYLEATDRNLRQGLFFAKSSVDQARACLKEGEARAAALAKGNAPWVYQKGFLTLGYRSQVDDSAQPYQVFVPAGYNLEQPRPSRLDVVLHGRGGNLNELSFITSNSWTGSYFGTDPLPNLTLYPYGRSNNGWRWGGERDVFEALADLKRRFRVDEDQVTLRGFSMGGGGTWHNGLHHPDQWAVMAPGAGFTDTRVYQKITDVFPEWQERLLHMYDVVDYARNAKNLPVLAYCGDEDPAVGQHQQMVKRLKEEDAPFKEYIGPKTPHRYEPAARTAILAEMAGKRRERNSSQVDYVTYTLRWPECKWVRVTGLERHWDRGEVQARVADPGKVEVTTRNVTALELTPPEMPTGPTVLVIDGQSVQGLRSTRTTSVVKKNGRWSAGSLKGLRKSPGMQGPIDDALFGPVVAVSGTGAPWSEPLHRWSKLELQRFRDGWDQYFRATLPERTDQTLTADDIRDKNLYLFGDPGSNAVLARILPKLPLRWTKEYVEIAGKRFSTKDHLPMLVYPNPESPSHYVVIDCGLTWSRTDWNGSNALQYSHLPDYAIIRYDADHYNDDHRKNAELAGFFDERWKP